MIYAQCINTILASAPHKVVVEFAGIGGYTSMAKILSLTDAEVGALMNLLEAPEVEINAPELHNLRRIYEKLSKSKVGKQVVTGSGSITVPMPGAGANTN